MAFDFPTSPTVGQKYPVPAVTGLPQYEWDGEKWVTLAGEGSSGGGGEGGSGVLIAAAPPVAEPNALWWESDSGTLYVRYDDGNTTQWVQAAASVAVGAVDTAAFVQKTGDTMTGHLSLPTAPASANAVRKDYVDAAIRTYAAPFDALAYNGMQINGGMEVAQEYGPSAGTPTSGKYGLDGWINQYDGTMVVRVDCGVNSDIPGFQNILTANVVTAQPSLGATNWVVVVQKVEGYRILRLAWGKPSAQPVTLAFWSSHQRPGIYTGVIRNGAGTRSYAFSYTHAGSYTPQYNVITIPGCTDGVWTTDNSEGLSLIFSRGCGATYTAPSLNSWLNGSYIAGPGQVNAVASTSDVFIITGVVLLPGIHTITAAQSPLLMRPYDQELVTCQRYLEPLGLGYIGGSSSPTDVVLGISYKVKKRVIPALSVKAGTMTVYGFTVGDRTTTTAPDLGVNNTEGATLNVHNLTSATTGNPPAALINHPGHMIDARL